MADHAVSEFIYIYDPDFNGIEVYRYKSPSEWKYILFINSKNYNNLI